jgi:hypothetical protein
MSYKIIREFAKPVAYFDASGDRKYETERQVHACCEPVVFSSKEDAIRSGFELSHKFPMDTFRIEKA